MYVILLIVTNHINWHRENLWSDRESTGNLKMKIEWVPCFFYPAKMLDVKNILLHKHICLCHLIDL